MLSEIDGKLSMLSEIGKLSKLSTGGKGEDLKCCRPEKFLFVGKNFRFVGKVQSTALAPPPQKNRKNIGPMAPLSIRVSLL
jgi:hypothetical protein